MTSILKVSTIQDPTNSNTALTIDSSGRVLMPQRPAFRAWNPTAYTRDFSSGGEAVIDFPSVAFDVGGDYDNTAGQSKFVAPVSGIYHLSTTVRLDGISGPSYAYIRWWKNGSGGHLDSVSGASLHITSSYGSSYQTFQMHDLHELTAGDYIQVIAHTPGDSSVAVVDHQAVFSAFLVA